MRARNIKPGFFKNEVIAELPMEARLLFIGLWTLADREGRLEDRPKRIKMELFAFDSVDIDAMLTRLHDDKFVRRYEVDGVKYIQVENFVKHQDPHYKEKASEIPPPDGMENYIKAKMVTRSQRARILERDEYKCQSCGSEKYLCIDHIVPVSRGGDSSDENLQVLCHGCNTSKGNKLDGEQSGTRKSKHRDYSLLTRANVDTTLNRRNCGSPSDSLIPDSLIPDSLIPDKPAKPSARKRAMPDDFTVSDRVTAWATEKGYSVSRVSDNFAKFALYAKSKGAKYADWDAALMTAIRDDWAKAGSSNQTAGTMYTEYRPK